MPTPKEEVQAAARKKASKKWDLIFTLDVVFR
jgi:hypothetical protein